eukprot:m.66924 g.66924  ORF g.66924 m.66924 type:complete len:695 (+) comp14066_c0_seq1:117-2201(+)
MLGWSGVLMQLTLFIVTIITSIVYLSSSWLRKLFTWVRPWRWRIRTLERQMQSAMSYDEWRQVALELDELEQKALWKLDPNGHGLYDQDRLAARLFRLREARTDPDISVALLQLRENLFRNIAGVGKPELYNHCHVGTKAIVDQYLQEIVNTIDHIAASPQLSIDDKERYLSDARQAYGRSALLLSGGASLGMMHWGVVKGLFKCGLLPPVICGNSFGALFVALLGIHDDDELHALFSNKPSINFSTFENLARGGLRRKVVRLLKHGVLMNISTLEQFCRDNVGDMTFEEAFNKTGRLINITLTHTTNNGYPPLLNHLTTPHVLLWSAACAACSQPGMYAPVSLMVKTASGDIVPLMDSRTHSSWSARSTIIHKAQLSMERMAELFNVNHFIVSQVNPHVVPFLRSVSSTSRNTLLHGLAMAAGSEVMHRLRQLAHVGWWPGPFVWIKSELLQQHLGHVTIVPTLTMTTLVNALTNPSPKVMRWFSREGARAVYPYMHVIELRCRVERALHDATRRVRSTIRSPRPSPYPSAYVSPLPARRSTGSSGRAGPGSPIPWSTVQPTEADRIPPKRRSPPPTSPMLSRKSSARTLLASDSGSGLGGFDALGLATQDAIIIDPAPSSPGTRALSALSSPSASMNASLSPAHSPSISTSLSPSASPMMGGFQSRLARQRSSFQRSSQASLDAYLTPDEID